MITGREHLVKPNYTLDRLGKASLHFRQSPILPTLSTACITDKDNDVGDVCIIMYTLVHAFCSMMTNLDTPQGFNFHCCFHTVHQLLADCSSSAVGFL